MGAMKRPSEGAELCQQIRDRILQSPQQRISFAEFMELALYHPQYGYYARNCAQLGFRGDFVTSVHLSNDFGKLLADQFAEMWGKLHHPKPFHLVEMGPGQGLLADVILSQLQTQHPDCLAAIHYTLIEKSAALRATQQSHLQPWQAQGIPLRWCTLPDLSPDSITGCLFSNELVDAFPVHRVILTDQGLQEQYVATTDEPDRSFHWATGQLSTPALTDYLEQSSLNLSSPPYPLGFTTEINLAAPVWMEQVAQTMHQGYVMTIDYGYPSDRYYQPARSQGTLQCYYQHAYHDNPLVNVGQQDITAHVDFTALERSGQRAGLTTLGTLPQGLFLMALGLGDRLNELAQWQGTDGPTIAAAIRRRDALHQLISPLGIGQFTVLIQAKGLTMPSQRQLQGLAVPS